MKNAVKHWKTTVGGLVAAVCSYFLAHHIGNPGLVSAVNAVGLALLGASASDADKTGGA